MQRPSATLHRILVISLALVCGACAKPAAEDGSAVTESPPEAVARALVADMLSLNPDQVALISVEQKDFSDSSLGCPSPGMSYLQVITPGHKVLVEADGRRFDVRVAGQHGKICHRRKPGRPREPEGLPESVSEAVAAVAPCATGARLACARFSAWAG